MDDCRGSHGLITWVSSISLVGSRSSKRSHVGSCWQLLPCSNDTLGYIGVVLQSAASLDRRSRISGCKTGVGGLILVSSASTSIGWIATPGNTVFLVMPLTINTATVNGRQGVSPATPGPVAGDVAFETV